MGLQGKQPENSEGSRPSALTAVRRVSFHQARRRGHPLSSPGSACVTWSLPSCFTQAVPSTCTPPFPCGPLITGFAHLSPLQDIFPAPLPLPHLQAADVFASSPVLPDPCLLPVLLACLLRWFTLGDPSLALSSALPGQEPQPEQELCRSIPVAPKGPERAWHLAEAPSMPVNRIRSIQDSDVTLRNLRSKCSSVWDSRRKQTSPGQAPLQRRPKLYLPPCHSAFPSSTHPSLGLSICSVRS